MLSPPDGVGKGVLFFLGGGAVHLCIGYVCPSIRPNRYCYHYRIYLMNGLSNFNEIYDEYSLAFTAPYRLRDGNAPWFMCWFQCYINRLFMSLLIFLPPFLPSLHFSFLVLSFLFTSLLVYFLTYLSTPFRIDPFHFQSRGCRRRPNLALVFWVHFIDYLVYFVMDPCSLLLCLL